MGAHWCNTNPKEWFKLKKGDGGWILKDEWEFPRWRQEESHSKKKEQYVQRSVMRKQGEFRELKFGSAWPRNEARAPKSVLAGEAEQRGRS